MFFEGAVFGRKIFCFSALGALSALVAKDADTGTKEQTKFFGKAFPKLHSVVFAMMESLGEKDALEVLDARSPKVSKRVTRSAKKSLPKKKLVFEEGEEQDEEEGAVDLSDKVVVDKSVFKEWFK